MIVEVPIRIESTPNLREHWAARSRRAGKHKHDTYFALKASRAPHELPCVVTLTRVAPRTLDTDNNVSGLKAVRDGVSLWLGVDDADPRVMWRYAQTKAGTKQYGLLVEILTARDVVQPGRLFSDAETETMVETLRAAAFRMRPEISQ